MRGNTTIIFDHVTGTTRTVPPNAAVGSPATFTAWQPLSVRRSRRKRIVWAIKGLRERAALRLAPWLKTW